MPDEDNIRSHIGILAATAAQPSVVGEAARHRVRLRCPGAPPPRSTLRTGQRRIRFTRILGGLLLAGMGATLTFVAIEARDRTVVPPPVRCRSHRSRPRRSCGPTLLLLARGAADSPAARSHQPDRLRRAAKRRLPDPGRRRDGGSGARRWVPPWYFARHHAVGRSRRPRTPPDTATAGGQSGLPPGGRRVSRRRAGTDRPYTQPSISDSTQAVAFYDD